MLRISQKDFANSTLFIRYPSQPLFIPASVDLRTLSRRPRTGRDQIFFAGSSSRTSAVSGAPANFLTGVRLQEACSWHPSDTENLPKITENVKDKRELLGRKVPAGEVKKPSRERNT